MRYHVYLINLGYALEIDFGSVQEAKEFGIEKGFEFAVYSDNVTYMGEWSPISGWKDGLYHE